MMFFIVMMIYCLSHHHLGMFFVKREVHSAHLVWCHHTYITDWCQKILGKWRWAYNDSCHNQDGLFALFTKTPNIPCFVVKNAFVAIYALFRGWYFHSLILVQIDLPLLLNHLNIFSIDKTGWLLIKKIGYRKNWFAIDRKDWLSIEQIGYR